MEDFPLQFDRPIFLWLLLLLIPTFFIARRSIGSMSRAKATLAFGARVVVVLLLATALAHPIWEKRGEGLTVTVILDRSQSVPLPLKRSSMRFLRDATEYKERSEDRVAVITVAKDAAITALPDPNSKVSAGIEGDLTATNLASAVRLAFASMPDDTANRIVLASDGNETDDSVLEAADVLRANGIPIDVLVLEYEHTGEVIFERIIAPARARRGQSVNLRLVLRSQSTATGSIHVTLNDQPFDLNGADPGTDFRVQLEPGVRVVTVPVSLDTPGPQRFEATFVPDGVGQDGIDRNNRAMAVTFVGGEGKVLVVDDGIVESQYVVQALEEGNIAVEVTPPGGVGDLIDLSGYDAIILANIPRWSFDDDQVRAMHAYVHDLGGGLVVLGGPNAFGAGGWIDTELARAMPVKLDPPQTRQMPRGALALIMHSCEMPQGNYWGQQVAQAAINALSRLDYVGIVEYNWNAPAGNSIGGCSWVHPMQLNDPKSLAINATKQMVVGDMPSFGPSMQLALNGLKNTRAGQKHVIIISDGDPQPPSAALLQGYKDAGITVTTVMVAGHGSPMDASAMQNVATVTGGSFHNVTNPKNLPAIFIKEAQLVSRSLIQEGETYQPLVRPSLSGPLRGVTGVPPVTGYILTAPREGLAQTTIAIPTEEGLDPIYAYWNYGLGRSVAFTSDVSGRWGAAWPGWTEFKSFWEQSVRWVMRRSSPSNMIVTTETEGDRSIIEIEALEGNAGSLNFLKTNAVVVTPDTKAEPLALQQVGPGRYRGEFRSGSDGTYLVNVNYAGGTSESPVEGNLQAAVTVPYSKEFRSVKHNGALLKDLATRTNGRELIGSDPALADLFNMETLAVPKSPKHIWDLLAILAASLFLLDVAVRRLTIDPKWFSMVLRRAVGRREDVSTGAVVAYRKARSQAEHRQDARKKREARAQRDTKFEATEADLKTSIDVGAEQDDADSGTVFKQPERPTTPAADAGDDEDFTSRLLRAKRRATQDHEDDDPTGDGNG